MAALIIIALLIVLVSSDAYAQPIISGAIQASPNGGLIAGGSIGNIGGGSIGVPINGGGSVVIGYYPSG